MSEAAQRILADSSNAEALALLKDVVQGKEAIALGGTDAATGWYPTVRQALETITQEGKRIGKIDEGGFASLRRMMVSDIGAAAVKLDTAYGRRTFRARFAECFARKRGPDSKFFSPAQELLLRLPFAGYYQTGYDLGLLEARFGVFPNVASTGFAVGPTQETLEGWVNGEVWSADVRPILFAHGHPSDPASLRYTREQLRELYTAGPLRRVLTELWGSRPMAILGVPCDDPSLAVWAEQKILPEGVRHPALISYTSDQIEIGEDLADLKRRLEIIGLAPIFYESDRTSKGEVLSAILESLEPVEPAVGDVKAPPPAPPPSDLKGRLSHRTTEDAGFAGREDALAQLAAFAKDPDVKTVALVGPGGIGKTALVGYWLKRGGGATQRKYDGVFYWSFNEDGSSTRFFAALQRFLSKELDAPKAMDAQRLPEAVADMLRQKAVLLILDGVDSLQEGPRGMVSSGALMDGNVRELVRRLVEGNAGLLIIASRFPLADLSRHLGGGFRSLRLAALSEDEGEQLLRSAGAQSAAQNLRLAARRLEGHPLALRILARVSGRREGSMPGDSILKVFQAAQIREDEPLEARIKGLLRHLERVLPADDVGAVGLCALFSASMPTDLLADMVRVLGLYGTRPGGGETEKIAAQFHRLAQEGLLVEEPGARAYSAHPVFRENLRQRILRHAKKIAQYLGQLRTSTDMKDIETARPILEAISILCDAGEYEHAHALYEQRLKGGEVFLKLRAPKAGLDCTLDFVGDARRRFACSRALSQQSNASLLRRASAFAISCGETSLGAEFNDLHIDLCTKADNPAMLSIALLSKGVEAMEFAGTSDARSLGRRAYVVSERVAAPQIGINALSLFGEANFYSGRVEEAWGPLEEAIDSFVRLRRNLNLGELRLGFVWAHVLMEYGYLELAANLFDTLKEAIILSKSSIGSPSLAAQRADCQSEPGPRIDAYGAYANTMRAGDHVLGLMPALIGLGRAYLDAGEAEQALEYAQEAADLAAPRGFTRRLAEAFALRAAARLSLGDARAAIDDAHMAVFRAEECEQAWVKRNALRVELEALREAEDEPAIREAAKNLEEFEKGFALADDAKARLERDWWTDKRPEGTI